MDTWILVADKLHASLMVQSCVGSLHEIESWACDSQMELANAIAARINEMQQEFDSLVVAAPPELLVDLSVAFGESLNGKVAAGLARDLMQLNPKQVRSELSEAHLV